MLRSKKGATRVLIPDGEKPVTIRVLHCLSEIDELQVIILSKIKNSSVRYSRFVDKFIFLGSISTTEWIESIDRLTIEHEIDVIMPVFETSIRELIINRENFVHFHKTLIPESISQYLNASDKWLLYNWLKKYALPTPNSYNLVELKNNRDTLEKLSFPLLTKPKRGIAGDGKGIRKFENIDDLRKFLDNTPELEKFVLQEYFDGVDLGFNVLCKNGRILAHTIQLGTLFDDNEFKPQIGLKFIHEKEVLSAAKKLMASLSWSGVAHIDFLYNTTNKKYVILEVNPRYWLTLTASQMSGVNFPWLYCQTVLGIKFDPPKYALIEHYDYRGLLKLIRTNPLFIFRLKTIWRKSPAGFLLSDFIMATHYLLSKLRDKLIGKK